MYDIGSDVSTKESALCILDGKGNRARDQAADRSRDDRLLYRRHGACPSLGSA